LDEGLYLLVGGFVEVALEGSVVDDNNSDVLLVRDEIDGIFDLLDVGDNLGEGLTCDLILRDLVLQGVSVYL
jgi:hypothetical protein